MNLYLVELERDISNGSTFGKETRTIREYEYAHSDVEALELVLERQGTTVTIKQCKPMGKRAELLEAAQRIRDETFNIEGCISGRINALG